MTKPKSAQIKPVEKIMQEAAAGLGVQQESAVRELGKPATGTAGHIQNHAYKPLQEVLIAFESGHYKEFKGTWLGDSVWGHHKTIDGRIIHVNKDKVEYIQTKEI